MRSGRDYIALGRLLAESFTVHVMDRRGRGASGPQGSQYSIDKERMDLLAVQSKTGATRVFGHSYGGFVCLETACYEDAFGQMALYEPGVTINGSIPNEWMPRYRERLARGDTRGAFASMVKYGGFAPKTLTKMPLWYVRLILRAAIRERQWRQMEPLLGTNLAEHEQQALLDDGTVDRYATIKSQTLLCGGTKSPGFITTEPMEALRQTIPNSRLTLLERLDHLAAEKKPAELAECLKSFFAESG